MNSSISRLRQWMILFTVTVSVFMSTLDSSIVNIALPSISKTLEVNINSIQWVVTSYLLTISVLLLIWGNLSDIYGKKYIFITGFIIFTAGSLFCGMSKSLGMLVLSRIVQAIGASCMMALSQGIVATTFPPEERGKALGINGTAVSIGSLTGPGLGGLLTHAFGWQSIFFVNIPIGIAGTILALHTLPNDKGVETRERFDYKGSASFILFVLLLFTGLLLMQEGNISYSFFILLMLISLISFVIFLKIELKTSNPFIDFKLFENPIFSLGILSAFLSFVALFTSTFFMPFYLQNILFLDAFKSGIIMSIYPATTAFLAPISGWLSDRYTYKPFTAIGLLLNTFTLFYISKLDNSTPVYKIAFLMALLGTGVALFQSPNNSSIMGSVPKNRLGVAGSINALFRNLGMVSGITLSVMLFTFVTKMNINNIAGPEMSFKMHIFLNGFRTVFTAASVCCFAGFGISLSRVFDKKYPQG